ncbi:MAG: NAD(P)/FAD-dependent oxidoreductase [Thermomicrobiales bacterium]|nr:NAD(P)/FAD-dependent oxidoreductase [Thermomicrobiales bacterium]
MHDVVVIGSGPNGLCAAIRLLQAGLDVLVLEAAPTLGGFTHDFGAAVFPFAVASPFLRSLDLHRHGLQWVNPEVAVAHPLPNGKAVATLRSVSATAALLDTDADAYAALMEPLVARAEDLIDALLALPRVPPALPLTARFAQSGLRSVSGLARGTFPGLPAQTLLAGHAAHSTLPLEHPLTAAFGLLLSLVAHSHGWPIPVGGASQVTQALIAEVQVLGGELRTDAPVRSMRDLPVARAYAFDTAPESLARVATGHLPAWFTRRLWLHRYGPGVCKVDYALAEAIPWRSELCRRAPTLHLGDSIVEIAASERAVWRGHVSPRPFVILGQPTIVDPSRAPAGQHTAWAYCHVPAGWPHDVSALIEAQIERHAPGFGARIVARRVWRPTDLQQANPNLVGGAINGGVQDLRGFLAWAMPGRSPHATPNPAIFRCSAATPPGGGVHGMCGFWAAEAILAAWGPRNGCR